MILVFAVGFLCTWLLTTLMLPWLERAAMVDVPNERSSHTRPTPRGGGVALLGGALAAIGFALASGWPVPPWPFFVAVGAVAVCGLVEDVRRGTPILLRLGVQLGAALLIVLSAGGIGNLPLPPPAAIPLHALGLPVAVLWIVAVTNIYNFLDGIDGYASMQGIIAGVGIALLDWGGPGTVVGLALAGGCAGFLIFNWHPARVFMGDVGALSLGFAFAALPFQMSNEVRTQLVFATALLLWFFLSDGTFTILSRLVRGERVWMAHRGHLYQRLVQTGMKHSQVVVLLVLVSGVVAALAVVGEAADLAVIRWTALASAVILFLAVYHLTQCADTDREVHHK